MKKFYLRKKGSLTEAIVHSLNGRKSTINKVQIMILYIFLCLENVFFSYTFSLTPTLSRYFTCTLRWKVITKFSIIATLLVVINFLSRKYFLYSVASRGYTANRDTRVLPNCDRKKGQRGAKKRVRCVYRPQRKLEHYISVNLLYLPLFCCTV